MAEEAEAEEAEAMEYPECPVCLQPYNSETTPRVLPCGHSACELCLSLLPSHSPHPNSLRCPSCTQLVRITNPSIGPKSFPKNIDLLRFCSSLPQPESKPKPVKTGSAPEPGFHFSICKWSSDQSLVRDWKNWILPEESVSLIIESSTGGERLVLGVHHVSNVHNSKFQKAVSLFPISVSSTESKWFRLSYMARVLESICRLEEKARGQLQFLLEACSRQRHGVCKVLGFWMNPAEETSPLFLVCENFDRTLENVLKSNGNCGLGLDTAEKFGFGMVGIEVCEIIMDFYSEGVCFGCLDIDCFSFDKYGHCLLDLNKLLVKSKRVCKNIGDENLEFLSPEVFTALHEGNLSVNHKSDVWSLGCMLAMIGIGDAEIANELLQNICCLFMKGDTYSLSDECLNKYEEWREKVVSKIEVLLSGTKFEPLLKMLSSCLIYSLEGRPQVKDIWCCIKNCYIEPLADNNISFDASQETELQENLASCLSIGNIDNTPKEDEGISQKQYNQNKFHVLRGHHDCITALVIGGGYLFSCSFDKTVNVWSLQDFSHIQTLRGHEHKVMAMVVIEETHPLCISGDSGSCICVWRIGTSLEQEQLKKWYEHNDWRYSGIHSLAISGEYLYSGSGDKSIKAWSLQDYSLAYTMTGHNSTVSCLAVADGVLYSGSWDGTVRLWCLSDHSLLSVFEDNDSSTSASVPILSLSVHSHFLVSAYENGSVKIWKNGTFMRSKKVQDGAIFAVHMDVKWLFTGGWNKFINIQEMLEDELEMMISPIACITCDSTITSLVSWHGKLFAGFSNKEIKVYYFDTK